MKNKPVCLILFLLLAHLTGIRLHAQISVEKILNGVVKITTFDYQGEVLQEGTGFITGTSDYEMYIVTASHVVENAISVQIMFYGPAKRTCKAEVLKREGEPYDIAVLAARPQFPEEFEYYKFKKSQQKNIKPNTPVGLVGHPYGYNFEINQMNHVRQPGAPYEILITANFINQGNSGGPLYSKKKRQLLGMVTRVQGNGAVAVKADEILWYLDKWKIPYNLIKRPVHKSTYMLGGASAGALALGYHFNMKGVKTYDKYQSYRDPQALFEKEQTTQDALFKDAQNYYLYRNISYGAAAATFVCGILVETGVMKKVFKKRKEFRPTAEPSWGFGYNGSLQSGINLKF